MNWFPGTIRDAIGAAKATDAIFVVYIYDSSDASTSTNKTLAEKDITSILNSKKFVAIKLENGSEESKQFSQIYPLILVPCLYFISGQTGIPLEVIGGAVDNEKLMEKLKKVAPGIQATVEDEPAAPEKMEVEESSATAVEPEASSSMAVDTSEGEKESTSCETDENMDTGEVKEKESNESNIPLEDKLERAKQLLAEKQAKEAEEKRQDEKRKEVERRNMGQEIAKRKRQTQEEEIQTAARERKKEKEEDKLARERVRAQIAADRLERERRAAELQGGASPSAPTNAQPVQQQPSANRVDATITRLKFRLPDGSSSIAMFPVETKFAEIYQHVQQTLVSSNFKLTSTVHHQPFTSDDNEKSLADLGLVPSAIIVILISGHSSTGGHIIPSGDGFMGLFWFLLTPLTFVLNFIQRFFSGSRSSSSGDSSGASSSNTNANTSGGAVRSGSSTTQNRPKTAYGRRNVHRLHHNSDDDENNTWNGNSTQQM